MNTNLLVMLSNVLNVTLREAAPAWAQMVKNAEPGEERHAYIAALDRLSWDCQNLVKDLVESDNGTHLPPQ